MTQTLTDRRERNENYIMGDLKKRQKRNRILTDLMKLILCALLMTGCQSQIPGSLDQEQPAESGSSFTVRFLDVGQADAALILCDGESMLIDGGNAEDSSLVYTCLKNLDISHLNYIVCTHAHEDHVGGLSGALQFASVDHALAPVGAYDSRAFQSFVKYLDQQGKSIEIPEAGDTFPLGSAQVEVLGPVRESDDTNNTSIVLKITYGETSFLFTGDAERQEEEDILNTGASLKSTVLKVGHHGSDTSTTYPFLREVMPEYAVISVGEGNSYGHPTENTLSRLKDAGAQIYRTDLMGDIICTSDGTNVFFAEEQTKPEEEPAEGTGTYILNTRSKKFHLPACPSVKEMSEKNKESYSGSREELLSEGYTPCGQCKP